MKRKICLLMEATLISGVLLVGCSSKVSKEDYNALQSNYDAVVAELESLQNQSDASVRNETTQSKPNQNTSKDNISIDQLPFSFDDLETALQNIDTEIQDTKQDKKEPYSVRYIVLGKGYTDVQTRVYGYFDTNDNLVAVQAFCADLSNYTIEGLYYNVIDTILNLSGCNISTVDNYSRVVQDGMDIIFTRNSNDYSGWANLIIYANKYDFSGDDYTQAKFVSSEPAPVVTYSDILAGEYNGREVRIQVVLDRIAEKSAYTRDFSVWYPFNDTYTYTVGDYFFDLDTDSSLSEFDNVVNGDIVEITIPINTDGSFGLHDGHDLEIIGKTDLDEIYQSFKNNCVPISNDMQRTPDKYRDTPCIVSGTIFQIISETDSSAEYLISTDLGYVKCVWYNDEDIRGARFLENDSIVIYGMFEDLVTYSTLLGENTVPQISIVFMELAQ